MIDIEKIKTVLSYDRNSGNFYWLCSRRSGIKPGDIAGHKRKRSGYVMLKVFGRQLQAHRLAWFYIHGYWPIDLDHKDRDRSNNAIENLREASPSQNTMNTGVWISNTSGYRGVTWNRTVKKWQAQAKIDGKNHYLGIFDNPLDASIAYEAFRLDRHGAFNGLLGGKAA